MTNPIDTDEVLAQVREALDQRDWQRAVQLVEALRPADQSDVFEELPAAEQDQLLPRLNPEDSADILEEMPDEEAAEVASRFDASDLAPIVDKMEPDEAADLLGDIAPAAAAEVLSAMEEPEEVRPLLEHADETAGGIMTPPEVTLHKDMTAEESINYLRIVSPQEETVYILFVVDNRNRLVGVVPLQRLITAKPSTRIAGIMDRDVISITADADQEEAARLMSRYDLLTLPVVDQGRHLLGVITHDDLVAVLEEESTEDIQRFGASQPLAEPYLDASVLHIARKRIGWLLLLFVTGTLTGTVLRLFRRQLAEVVALSVFIPLLIGTGGNAGSQVAAAVIRAIAVGEVRFRDLLLVVWREVRVALLLGLVMAAVGLLRAITWNQSSALALTVALSLLAIVVWSALIGAALPLIAARLKIDPTVVSGPAMSTLVDAVGLIIYFSVAGLVMGI